MDAPAALKRLSRDSLIKLVREYEGVNLRKLALLLLRQPWQSWDVSCSIRGKIARVPVSDHEKRGRLENAR